MATSDTNISNLIINQMTESELSDLQTAGTVPANQVFVTEDATYDFVSMPIGTIFSSAIPQSNAAFHLLDGSTISKTGIYSQFATLLNDLVNGGYDIACTQVQFDSDISTYGQCGKFVIGSDTIRLPKITKFIEGLSSITNIGTSFQAGLPNITGNTFLGWNDASGGGIIMNADNVADSALYHSRRSGKAFYASGSSHSADGDLELDASRSSAVYGRSSTVQPQSTAYPYYIVVANSYKMKVQVDIDQVASDLNLLELNKSDKNLVASLVTTTTSNNITITGLNGIVADGGIYDIFINGATDGGGNQWVFLNNTDVGNFITHSGSSIYAERQDTAIGTLSDYGMGIHCVLYKPRADRYGIRVSSSISYNANSHQAVSGCGIYYGDGTTLTFTLNNSKLFAVNTVVKVYKRS